MRWKVKAMSERPILFSAEMVRAILDGRKTQTRRNIKYTTEHRGPINPAYLEAHKDHPGWKDICPYGQPGDLLWVRETWTQYPIELNPEPCDAWYKATSNGPPPPFKWRPSIHMPRWASRITLRITDIRVERLQDISEDDARAEGCPYSAEWAGRFVDRDETAKTWFKSLWNKINGPGAWDENPWVWAISFERVKP
jgi:hypothetical protein